MNYVESTEVFLIEALPDCGSRLVKLYALLAHTKGVNTTLKDVHEAWALWKTDFDPDHRSLIPFEELSPEVQELDRPYMEAIHKAARRINK